MNLFSFLIVFEYHDIGTYSPGALASFLDADTTEPGTTS